jgi:hypothetical protein
MGYPNQRQQGQEIEIKTEKTNIREIITIGITVTTGTMIT